MLDLVGFALNKRSFLPKEGSRDNSTCVRDIFPTNSIISRSGSIHGFTHLGFRSYPSGSFVPEAVTMSFSFFRSDEPFFITTWIRPVDPCQLTSVVAGPIFSYIRNPNQTIPGRFHASSISVVIKAVIAALRHWVSVLQGHKVLITTDNTTVVSYINKQGGTHSLALLRLVVDLFM